MKIAKLSLMTVLALGTSAYAVDLENIKISGQATLYYQTQDNNPDDKKNLFAKENANANIGLSVNFNSDLGNGFGFGARLNVLDTLGLEGELVNGVMQVTGAVKEESGATATNSDEWYFGEAYLTKKVGNTLIKAGRQELNTPLAFSEKWNVMPTTFDAAVMINSDLAESGITLVGAYVSKSNNHFDMPTIDKTEALGNFYRIGKHGAYAVAALYSQDDLKANAWLYSVPSVANAIWIDANAKIGEASVTGQLATFMFDTNYREADDTVGVALKVGYKISNDTKVCVAVGANTGKEKSHTVSNVGTGIKTRLATATISGDGDVAGATDTTAYKIKVVQGLGEYGKAIVQFAQYMHGENSSSGFADQTATVFEAIYKQKVGGIDLLGAYVYDQNVNVWTKKVDDASNAIRVVARYNF